MGRPREFNEAEVLQKVTEVFRTHGYEGTSIGDLEAATGVGRASLYGAFGDKRALFVRVFSDYSQAGARIIDILDNAPSLREGLRRLFAAWTSSQLDKPVDERGCFALQTAVSSCEMVEAQAIVWRTEQVLQDAVVAAIARARDQGEVGGSTTNDGAVARLVVTTLQGIAASARVVPGGEEAALRAVSDTLVDAVFALLGTAKKDASSAA